MMSHPVGQGHDLNQNMMIASEWQYFANICQQVRVWNWSPDISLQILSSAVTRPSSVSEWNLGWEPQRRFLHMLCLVASWTPTGSTGWLPAIFSGVSFSSSCMKQTEKDLQRQCQELQRLPVWLLRKGRGQRSCPGSCYQHRLTSLVLPNSGADPVHSAHLVLTTSKGRSHDRRRRSHCGHSWGCDAPTESNYTTSPANNNHHSFCLCQQLQK